MLFAPLMHRTGLVLSHLHTAGDLVRRRGQHVTRDAYEAHKPVARRPHVSQHSVSYWDADDGEPTWEDAEWQ